MGRWNDILIFFASENVNGGEIALGVSVFPGLGDGDVTHLHMKVRYFEDNSCDNAVSRNN